MMLNVGYALLIAALITSNSCGVILISTSIPIGCRFHVLSGCHSAIVRRRRSHGRCFVLCPSKPTGNEPLNPTLCLPIFRIAVKPRIHLSEFLFHINSGIQLAKRVKVIDRNIERTGSRYKGEGYEYVLLGGYYLRAYSIFLFIFIFLYLFLYLYAT